MLLFSAEFKESIKKVKQRTQLLPILIFRQTNPFQLKRVLTRPLAKVTIRQKTLKKIQGLMLQRKLGN